MEWDRNRAFFAKLLVVQAIQAILYDEFEKCQEMLQKLASSASWVCSDKVQVEQVFGI